jgi:hypothetical protein
VESEWGAGEYKATTNGEEETMTNIRPVDGFVQEHGPDKAKGIDGAVFPTVFKIQTLIPTIPEGGGLLPDKLD